MKNYLLIETSDKYKLTEQVKYWMEQGWICQGGICIFHEFPRMINTLKTYAQAMIKE